MYEVILFLSIIIYLPFWDSIHAAPHYYPTESGGEGAAVGSLVRLLTKKKTSSPLVHFMLGWVGPTPKPTDELTDALPKPQPTTK